MKPYITIQKWVIDEYKQGKISRNELILYWWLRSNANPYGITTASLPAIRDDMFKDVGLNYINKLLLSLRGKKYLYYEDRQGRRGSFEVHFGDWKLPNGQFVNFEKYFQDEGRSSTSTNGMSSEEVNTNFPPLSQRSEVEKELVTWDDLSILNKGTVRTPYNDNDNNKNKLNIDGDKSFKGKPLDTFNPSNSDEYRCLEIAQSLGETNIDFLLSVLKTDGIELIERAWGIFREQSRKTHFENPAAYFNSIIKGLKSQT